MCWDNISSGEVTVCLNTNLKMFNESYQLPEAGISFPSLWTRANVADLSVKEKTSQKSLMLFFFFGAGPSVTFNLFSSFEHRLNSVDLREGKKNSIWS